MLSAGLGLKLTYSVVVRLRIRLKVKIDSVNEPSCEVMFEHGNTAPGNDDPVINKKLSFSGNQSSN